MKKAQAIPRVAERKDRDVDKVSLHKAADNLQVRREIIESSADKHPYMTYVVRFDETAHYLHFGVEIAQDKGGTVLVFVYESVQNVYVICTCTCVCVCMWLRLRLRLIYTYIYMCVYTTCLYAWHI